MPSDTDYLCRINELSANDKLSPTNALDLMQTVIEERAMHRGKDKEEPDTSPVTIAPRQDNQVHCCICLNVRSGARAHTPAVSVVEGYALCAEHLQWVYDESGYRQTYRSLIHQALHHHATRRNL